MKKLFELTDYPEIYQNTYWGNFPSLYCDKDIINNRNYLKEFLNLEFLIESSNGKAPIFDHLEYYNAGHCNIMVISPYKEIMYDDMIKMELTPFRRVYSNDTYTYYREFYDDTEYRKFLNEV